LNIGPKRGDMQISIVDSWN